jgi:hypothetical protein
MLMPFIRQRSREREESQNTKMSDFRRARAVSIANSNQIL